MDQGWVYVLVNSSMPGLAKVGRTTRPPSDRVAELSGATGVATPFVLAFDQMFDDCGAAERAVHDELDRRGWRVASNREFFRGSPSDIIRIILEVADAPLNGALADAGTTADALLEAGDRAYFGLGDTLQDEGEALRLFKLAAARGSLIAYERLGRIYLDLYKTRPERAARRRLLAVLKEGARRGNYYCFAELALVFAGEAHLANFEKAWALFFTRRREARLEVLEGGERFTEACCRYIASCLELGLAPEQSEMLAGEADRLIEILLSAIDEAREDAFARGRVVAVLRWVHQTLLGRPQPAQAAIREHWFGRVQRLWIGRRDVAAA